MVLEYSAVVLVCALVAAAELLARHRHRRVDGLLSPAAVAYVAVNGVVAAGTLAALTAAESALEISAGDRIDGVTLVALAALSALAFLRSSLFIARVGGLDVSIGPRALLEALIESADRQADRRIAAVRAEAVWNLMRDVPFERVSRALPAHALALTQNLADTDQEELASLVQTLESSDLHARSKSLALGTALANLVGIDVLRAALETVVSDAPKERPPA